MQDKKGNQKVFINGYLAKIQDSHQNKIFLEYNGNSYNGSTTAWSPLPETSTSRPTNRVTGVVQVNNGSGITRIATLSYGADNYLQRITDRAGRKTTFTYAEASGVKLLTQIQHPDGTTADYKYQAGGYLTDAYDSEGKNGVQYGYPLSHSQCTDWLWHGIRNKICFRWLAAVCADAAHQCLSFGLPS